MFLQASSFSGILFAILFVLCHGTDMQFSFAEGTLNGRAGKFGEVKLDFNDISFSHTLTYVCGPAELSGVPFVVLSVPEVAMPISIYF